METFIEINFTRDRKLAVEDTEIFRSHSIDVNILLTYLYRQNKIKGPGGGFFESVY